MFKKELETFYKANIICFFSSLIILGFSFIVGKVNLFLMLNIDLGTYGDFIFNYITYLGDGLFLIPIALYLICFKRNYLLLFIISIVLSTLIAHYIKGHVIAYNPRPVEEIKNMNLIHVIPNVEIHYVGSFPSGHTTQAFCLFLLFCILLNKKTFLFVGFFVALLVGYSRVYQAQHFPIDVAGGILVAMFSSWIGLLLSSFIKNIVNKKNES